MASLQFSLNTSTRASRGPPQLPHFEGLRQCSRPATSPTTGLFGLWIDPRSFRSLVATDKAQKIGVVRAAWTRRSRSEAEKKPNRKSWGQRTEMFMKPFLLNVFFSRKFIHAKVIHRGTSKVISVATTNAKDLRNTLPSLIDNDACRVIGKLVAERCKDADVFAIAYDAKRNERIEGRLGIILDTIRENDIIILF